MACSGGLSEDLLAKLDADFSANSQLLLGELSTLRLSLFESSLNRKLVDTITSSSSFQHSVSEVTPVTDQKKSGRCWLFAALNMLRIPLAKHFGVHSLEFSQSHLFFWDKVERGYYLLHCYLECAERGEDVEGRLVQHLLANPAEDGGQWDMVVNLISKYGIMPKQCYTEPLATQETMQFNFWLNTWHRQSAKLIFDMYNTSKDSAAVKSFITSSLLPELYRFVSVAFGRPPKEFTFEFSDNNISGEDKFRSIGPITPKAFFEKHVQPVMDVTKQVCLINDPRNEYYRLYTVDMLNNMRNARRVLYINLPSEDLKRLSTSVLSDRVPVWFGSHVSKGHSRIMGIGDPDIYRLDLLFGLNINKMNKKERLVYRDSLMTHAMLLTGVTPAIGTNPGKWRVENSWTTDYGNKGYLTITDNWFDEYVYEVAIDKDRLSPDVAKILDQEPIVLPAWEPMGALAQ